MHKSLSSIFGIFFLMPRSIYLNSGPGGVADADVSASGAVTPALFDLWASPRAVTPALPEAWPAEDDEASVCGGGGGGSFRLAAGGGGGTGVAAGGGPVLRLPRLRPRNTTWSCFRFKVTCPATAMLHPLVSTKLTPSGGCKYSKTTRCKAS